MNIRTTAMLVHAGVCICQEWDLSGPGGEFTISKRQARTAPWKVCLFSAMESLPLQPLLRQPVLELCVVTVWRPPSPACASWPARRDTRGLRALSRWKIGTCLQLAQHLLNNKQTRSGDTTRQEAASNCIWMHI